MCCVTDEGVVLFISPATTNTKWTCYSLTCLYLGREDTWTFARRHTHSHAYIQPGTSRSLSPSKHTQLQMSNTLFVHNHSTSSYSCHTALGCLFLYEFSLPSLSRVENFSDLHGSSHDLPFTHSHDSRVLGNCDSPVRAAVMPLVTTPPSCTQHLWDLGHNCSPAARSGDEGKKVQRVA